MKAELCYIKEELNRRQTFEGAEIEYKVSNHAIPLAMGQIWVDGKHVFSILQSSLVDFRIFMNNLDN